MKEELLRKAISLAEENIERGGGPFGALVVKEGKVIAAEANKVTPMNDPTAHAEILAIRSAAETLGTWNLSGCELYTSCEPCPMCLGAIYWAHIDKVYYAANHEDARAAGFDDADMYSEFQKDPSLRKVKMQEGFAREGRDVFRKWMEKEDRREY